MVRRRDESHADLSQFRLINDAFFNPRRNVGPFSVAAFPRR